MNVQSLSDSMLRTSGSDPTALGATAGTAVVVRAAVPAPKAQAVEQRHESERIKAAAQQLDSYLKSAARNLEFRVDERSGRVVVTVHDTATGDVIRQIPNEETLRLAEHISDPAHGAHAVMDIVA